ncbi:transcriptional regulator [Saccharothrix sp. NRRL B-16348]|uniref:GntR family transcriptional regulator n=1 Tax=Saccharothrix sp. NRRL B-16348 TaxID=1415542 RepID=UPI0006AE4AF0|nr:GntR family transcriptional regulator [Saccharothrix sp. NRRL B-16348]KOX13345.1 transcriptional regulator [Saccharothrix sp. NRRL B-16348]
MIDKTSGVPAYRQVATDIRAKIESGEYAPGAPIPSERTLVDQYGVSRPTIRDAIALLRQEGALIAEHGRGVFVRPRATVQRLSRSRLSRDARTANRGAFLGDASAGGFTPSTTVKIRFEPADERTADLLGLDAGEEVTVRDRVMRADGLAVMLAVSRLPRSITRGTAIEEVNTGPGGAYARLEENGHTLTHFEEIVSARMPTPEEASILQLSSGVPVVRVTRVAYAGRAVEVNDMTLASDRYELIYHIPAD